MTQTALVLGQTGRFGRNATRAFKLAGWEVRGFDRASDRLAAAAKGADVIVYGWNPSYDKWHIEVAGQLERVICAAHASNATVLFPGNVYVYGSDSTPTLSVDTAHAATNSLGVIRCKMENALRASGVKTIILRAGDFLDTEASGNWFDRIIAKNLAKGILNYPGNTHIPHAWTFLPDFARAFVALADIRHELPDFTSLNYEGYTLSGLELAAHLNARITRMHWLPVQLLRPFWPMARHLLEMRYLWDMPHQLDGSEFKEVMPGFQPTPVLEALRTAVSFQIDPNQPVVRTRLAT